MTRAVLAAALLALRVLPGDSGIAHAAPLAVAEWHLIGPFEVGSREGLVHPLAEPDGSLPAAFDLSRTWPSMLAEGGRVGWRSVQGERDAQGALTGGVPIDMPGIDWEARQDEWGAAAVANVAVLVGHFELAEDRLLLVDAARCGGSVAGQPFAGDPYGAGIARSVVRGRRGRNVVVLLSAGWGPVRQPTFLVEPLEPGGPTVLIVADDASLPDLAAGQAGSGFAGVALVNLADTWQDVEVEISGGMQGRSAQHRLAPLAPLKIPVPVTWPAVAEAGEIDARVIVRSGAGLAASDASASDASASVHASVPASMQVGEPASVQATVQASVRPAGAPRRETFLSRLDGSAQEYGVRPPRDGERPGQALLMSTHGAGVGALGQVQSYGPKDGMTIVAPTNRRPFGFDWHDWGRLDFEEVLVLAKERFRPDPGRIHLTGHSMGGHGAWTLGALHADEFASVAPAAGWASYDTYVPFTTRRSTWLASPELNALLMRGLATGRASVLLENLRHVPVQVLQGGKDDNVAPSQARMMAGLLERLGGNVRYVEVAGQGHWWDLDEERPGADAVDAAVMEEFWTRHAREPWPRSFTFVTPDPDVDATRHWIRIDAQDVTASESRIEADAMDPARLILSTRNVAGLSLDLGAGLGLLPDAGIEIDGAVISAAAPAGGGWLSLRRGRGGAWERLADPVVPAASPQARPGGLAKALFAPFVIVLPTQGDAARREALAATGRFIAGAWWVRANGHVPIVQDTEITHELRRSHALLLLGGPDLNRETQRIASSLKLVASAGEARLAGRRLPGRDLACAHWQPSPDAPGRRILVLQATSAEADALLPGLQPIAAGTGLPDFVAASPRVRLAGIGGFVAAGFWSPAWEIDPASTWLAAGAGPAEWATSPSDASSTAASPADASPPEGPAASPRPRTRGLGR